MGNSKEEKMFQLTELRRGCRRCNELQAESHGIKRKLTMYNSSESQGVKDSEMIGAWTEWNGNLDAEIMVIGQDWGTKKHYIEFRNMEEKADVNDRLYEKESNTNKNLAKCIAQISKNWDILEPLKDGNNAKYPLFFTNEILCYKDKIGEEEASMNTPIPVKCYQECVRRFLIKEINIIEPEVVVFLGAETYKNFIRTIDKEKLNHPVKLGDKFSNLVKYSLDLGSSTHYTLDNGNKTLLVPMYHPGGLGCSNKKRTNVNSTKTGLELIQEDWEKLGRLLKILN